MEEKQEKPKKRGIGAGRVIGILLLILALVSAGVWLYSSGIIQNFLGEKKYEEIANSVKNPVKESVATEAETEEETEPEYICPIDFDELWARNPDVIGWVTIPNTQIDYPILWSGDNDYYLHHDIDGQSSVYGAIYLDGDDKPDFSSLHNVTYGHHMKNGSMYENIVNFKEEEFFKNNRDVYIYTPDKEYHLKTMACLYTDASGERRQTLFVDKTEFDTYVDNMTEGCKFREVPLDGVKQLWSFVTCSYEFNNARTILYCYEVDADGEKAEPDEELYRTQMVPAMKPSELNLSGYGNSESIEEASKEPTE